MALALLSAIAGALCGVAALAILRRFSDQPAIRVARARVRAHLYELALFGDEPVLMLRAQKNLLLWNLRYLRLTAAPAAIVAVPVLLAGLQLDALCRKRALLEGESVVVSAQLKAGTLPEAELVATPPFRVESPPVRIADSGRIFWRVRTTGASDGILELSMPGEAVKFPIRAGPGLRYVSTVCTSSSWGWIQEGCRIGSVSVQSVTIDYPDGEIAWLGWFSAFLLAAMLTLRRRFGVAF